MIVCIVHRLYDCNIDTLTSNHQSAKKIFNVRSETNE